MNQMLLSGDWDFRLDSETAWRQIRVPGCWEQIGVRKDLSGPAWYRTSFMVPADWAGKRIWLRFGAVSYHCEIFVNGQALGSHTGLWDSFAIEISAVAAPGAVAELLVRVEKPAGLTAGPDSASLPGRFPLRETLAGFLPYVWGHIFGGIWQDVTLYATGAAIFEDVLVRGAADGRVSIAAALSGPGAVTLDIRDPDGRLDFMHTSATSETKDEDERRKAIRPSSFVLRTIVMSIEIRSSPTRAPGRQAPRRCTRRDCAWRMATSACCALGCARCALKGRRCC